MREKKRYSKPKRRPGNYSPVTEHKLSKIYWSAQDKEYELLHAEGPSSIPDERYPKTVQAKKREE